MQTVKNEVGLYHHLVIHPACGVVGFFNLKLAHLVHTQGLCALLTLFTIDVPSLTYAERTVEENDESLHVYRATLHHLVGHPLSVLNPKFHSIGLPKASCYHK